MAEWSAEDVAEALREAVAACRTAKDVDSDPVQSAAMARVTQLLVWLSWLAPLDAELVEMRASGAPWKPICWRLGIGRATAHRRWKAALRLIAERLTGP